MYKKNIKWLLLGILIIVLFSIINLSSSKYAEIVDTQITLNIRKPIYTIKFHPNDGGDDDYIAQSFTYGTAQDLTRNSFIKTGYDFKEWNSESDGSGSLSFSDREEVNNLTTTDGEIIDLYAIWEEAENGSYKVIHKKMDLDGVHYTTVETDEEEGTPGESVTPIPKNYTGFTSPQEQTVTIAADGSTTITYLYNRKQYHVSIINEDLLTISNGITSGYYYYGTPIHVAFTPNVPGVTFHFDDYLVTEVEENAVRINKTIDTEIIDLVVENNLIIEPEFSSYPVGYFKPFNGTPWLNGGYAPNHNDVFFKLYTDTSSLTGNGPLRDPSNTNYDEYMFGDMNNPTNGLSKKGITKFTRNTTKTIEEVEAMYEAGTAMLVSNEVDDGYQSPVEVYAWIEGTTMYWDSRAYIVKFHPDTIAPFYCMYDATSIDLTNLDTSLIKNFYSFFNTCLKVTEIKGFINTSGVEYPGESNTYNYISDSNENNSSKYGMAFMFNDCKRLITLDVSKFDTSNVVDMKRMFAGCAQLKTLDLFSFDTSKVKSFYWMFRKCGSLAEIRISSFDTSELENALGMFRDCSKLKTVYLGDNFITPNLYNCSYMFLNCTTLERIYASNDFDRTHITSATGLNMFKECKKLIGGYEYETIYATEKVNDSSMAQVSTSAEHKGYFTSNDMGTKYYLSYNLNGGTSENPSYYYETSPTFSLGRATKEGYIFKGWTGSNGNEPELDVVISQGSIGDRNYVANFEPITYMINFYPNGGDGTLMSSQEFTYDVAQTLFVNTYTNDDKQFLRWNTEADGSGTNYIDEESILNITNTNGDIINLYAQWTSQKYDIIYHYGTYNFVGNNYLDAGIQLYSEYNFDRNFEITLDISDFTPYNIDSSASGDKRRNALICAQYEVAAPYPGFGFQYRDDKGRKIYFQANTSNYGYSGNEWITNPANTGSVSIRRTNGLLYFNSQHATDGVTNENIDFNNLSNSMKIKMKNTSIPLTFAINMSSNGSPRRFSHVTMTDICVKLEYSSDDINTFELATPKFTAHSFDGWYTGPNGTGTKITSKDQITEATTDLYAKWN